MKKKLRNCISTLEEKIKLLKASYRTRKKEERDRIFSDLERMLKEIGKLIADDTEVAKSIETVNKEIRRAKKTAFRQPGHLISAIEQLNEELNSLIEKNN